MSFVSRVPQGAKSTPMKTIKRRDFDEDDEDAVRKSFNVMEIFLNPMNDLDRLLTTKLPALGKTL